MVALGMCFRVMLTVCTKQHKTLACGGHHQTHCFCVDDVYKRVNDNASALKRAIRKHGPMALNLAVVQEEAGQEEEEAERAIDGEGKNVMSLELTGAVIEALRQQAAGSSRPQAAS